MRGANVRNGSTARGSALLACLLAAVLGTGCAGTARPLMPTPALYAGDGSGDPFARTPAERRTSGIELLFVTDRMPATEEEGVAWYGAGRSPSIAFGTVVVEMVPDLDWAAITEQSRLLDRTRPVNLELRGVEELGRFPDTPYAVDVVAGERARSRDALARHVAARTALQDAVGRQLARAPSGRVVLYVHGFNETFETAALTAAELCHFLGREDVCAFFTWPASARGGFLTSYAASTESAEFAVNHLRKVIRDIAATPGVEGINLLAHSRGAAVVLSAMQLLLIEAIAYGVSPAEQYGIEHIVLVAPDVDVDVASKKIEVFTSDPDLLTHWPDDGIPRVLRGGRLTIYSSPQDRALRASRFLFRSRNRLGQVSRDSLPGLTDAKRQLYAKFTNIDVISYSGKRTDRYGHSYFTSNSRVSADLVALLRYGEAPGGPGRPLRPVRPPLIWELVE